jgi:hypothetical protein
VFIFQAGIGSAYLKRPCIEPLDDECPYEAPNGYNICKAVTKFRKWNETLPTKIYLTPEPLPVEPDSNGDLFAELLGKYNLKLFHPELFI